MTAKMASRTLVTSSMTLTTGAATPAVMTFNTGLADIFARCTISAITTPETIGTH